MQLKVVSEGSVLRLKESFQNEAQFKMQHELEMKQREEQQEMFTRIDQSRLAIPLDQSAVSQSHVAEERKNTKALPRRDVGPTDIEEGITKIYL